MRTIVEEGPARIKELIELGMKFSEREDPEHPGSKELDLGKEGGHTRRRILHAKDVTGREIERALLNAISTHPNIQIFENFFAIDLFGETGFFEPHDFRISNIEEIFEIRRLKPL